MSAGVEPDRCALPSPACTWSKVDPGAGVVDVGEKGEAQEADDVETVINLGS